MNKLRYMFSGAGKAIGAVLLSGSMTLLNGEAIYIDGGQGINH